MRRFCAGAAKSLHGGASWRSRAHIAAVRQDEVACYTRFVHRSMLAFPEETSTVRTPKKTGSGAARRAATFVRDIERAVDQLLGTDEAARRYRHYVAEHDAPADDASAYARLCTVVFAQGLGFGAVDAKWEFFTAAFAGFAPDQVAAFDEQRIEEVLRAHIIRNEAKVRACVENARRWIAASGSTTYLSMVAQTAVEDDAEGGWPALVQRLQSDFARIGETAARQTLKRWGFFTAFAHPGSRRVLERLEVVAQADSPAAVQCFVGSVARAVGRDPYQIEAVLALFASLGPCRREPDCESCALAEKCPTAANASAAAS
ncbi:MAG TPA: DNA-3-methyladenine glycosylase I [Candidatus Eremiobacteraceae bacterium]|nr:DNA-3-methyladenine glycosylase I [Candidatus Eremiobacteraceae bacterium]